MISMNGTNEFNFLRLDLSLVHPVPHQGDGVLLAGSVQAGRPRHPHCTPHQTTAQHSEEECSTCKAIVPGCLVGLLAQRSLVTLGGAGHGRGGGLQEDEADHAHQPLGPHLPHHCSIYKLAPCKT